VNRRKLLRVVAGLVATGPLTVGMAAPEPARPELAPGKLAIVLGPDSSGQTSWLLRWAARLLNRSGRNVVFSSVVDRPWQLRSRMAVVGDPSGFVEEAAFADLFALGLDKTPCVILQGIGTQRAAEPFKSASWLRAHHPAGCAGVVLAGWSMMEAAMMTAEGASVRAVALPEAASLAQPYARVMGLPVIMGGEAEQEGARAESAWVERSLVGKAERVVTISGEESPCFPEVP
jgi:hypothetical protein